MKTKEEIRQDILGVIPFIRYAIKLAKAHGAPQLAIAANFPNGSGKIIASFDAQFLEDVASLADAPPYTEEDEIAAKAALLLDSMGLS